MGVKKAVKKLETPQPQKGHRIKEQWTAHASIDQLAKFKLLIDSVQDYAIFLLDTEGYVQTWNKGAERSKGYRADEIIGKHFSAFYIEQDIVDRKPEKELEIAKRLGRTEDEDWRVRKDGTRFWANVVITALYDNGELVGFGKVTRDLTERKQQEDALRKANTSLNKQQRVLKELNTSKDEFISLASHQLRTPATAIKQLLGLILEGFEGDVSPELHSIIAKSYESNERQINIINSLLKVAQIDAGKVVLKKMPVAFEALVEGVVGDHTKSILERQQSITFSPAFHTAPVYVDASYFRMALENVIDNASKYSFEGTTIQVSTATHDGYVAVTVKDEGVGMSADQVAVLFEKFTRLPNSLSHRVPGTGLGLYWMKKIIDLHGGSVDVTSEPGKGTAFTITIPIEETYA